MGAWRQAETDGERRYGKRIKRGGDSVSCSGYLIAKMRGMQGDEL
jgi:hypothetical protein